MPHLSSELFRTISAATPDRVWRVLTCGGEEPSCLHGLEVHAEWRAGSTVTTGIHGGPQLTGTVLRADPPRLLSYTLGDKVDEPSVYVTWEIRAEPTGTIVRLYVDEPGPSAPTEIETAWLPVLAALDRRLQRCGEDLDGPDPVAPHDS